MSATYYMKLGQVPRKRHIVLPREKAKSHLGEWLHYEHVVTTAGFDRAYSIMYHLRPPTRIKAYKLAEGIPCDAADEQPLRHHHLRSQDMPRRGDAIRGRVPILFNEDLTAYRCKPEREQAPPWTELDVLASLREAYRADVAAREEVPTPSHPRARNPQGLRGPGWI